MPPGPLPQSSATKRARGNPGKRKLATTETTVRMLPAGDAQPNHKLRPAARHVWNALAPELQRLNILRGTDSHALSRYCADLAQYWEVSAQLVKEGLTYTVKSLHGTYNRINPLFAIQDRLVARLIVTEDRFGLSPQARQTLMVRAAQLTASQGNLPFGGEVQTDATPATAESPVGIFGAPPTSH